MKNDFFPSTVLHRQRLNNNMQTRKNGMDRFNDKDTQTSCMWNGAETQIHHGARGDPGLMGRLD